MVFEEKYIEILNNVEKQFFEFNLTINEGLRNGNSDYISRHKHEYLRTIQDVDTFLKPANGKDIFEIGAFFGAVSIALARMGYNVTASDVPEYMDLPAQKERFSNEGVIIHKMNLNDYIISLPDESVDCVIMCEVLEHLNFNPLPLFKEINRILRKGGLFYLSLPNGAQVKNRARMLLGRPIGLDVKGFFDQLDPSHELLANGHWREYTMNEVQGMLEPLGFKKKEAYFFSLGECQKSKNIRKTLGKLFYRSFPFFKENQTNLYIKDRPTSIVFEIPGTVHSSIRTL